MTTSERLRLIVFLCVVSTAPLVAQEKTLPVFTGGQAQIVAGFASSGDWIRERLWVETSFDSDGDGKLDRVHVDVTRQKQTETEGLKVPVIYETSPYFAGVGGTNKDYFWNPRHELGVTPPKRETMPPIRFRPNRERISNSQVRTWLPRGFAVVHSESPGTGLSQGCPTVGGENEALAPKAVIDWLNGRAKGFTTLDGKKEIKADWCTGKVGMTGTSYNGTLPLAAATTGVDGLEAIIPIAPNTSYYHYYRSNGLVRHPGGYMGEDLDVLYDFINSGSLVRREWCNEKIRDELMAANIDRLTGDYSDFWAGRNYLTQLDKLKAATLMAHGFNDWNVMPRHTVDIYAALKQKGVPCMAFFHQGGHGGPPPMVLQNKWFTRFLYGIQNGVETEPKAWIVREDARMANPTPYADYPNPGASPVRMFLSAGGSTQGGLGLKAIADQKPETLIDDVKHRGSTLAKAEKSENRLLFVTPELKEALHISGTAKITIRLSASKPAVNLSVWLVSLPWTRTRRVTENIITRGWADPQNRNSLREGEPLVPGEFVEMTFDLQPDDQIIPVGQQIGLMIFASDRDFTLWPPAGTKLTVDISATSLVLPVVGGDAAVAAAIGKK